MWSFGGRKGKQSRLWQALDHQTGDVLAYVFGKREDKAFLALKTLLKPFGIQRYYTDSLGTYKRHLEAEQHCLGKRHPQKLERKHLGLRTRLKRLARKTICFSKSIQMHDLVIGLFITRSEFMATI